MLSELLDIAVLVNALGWTLVHFVWQGAMIAALMWFLHNLIPQKRSQLRYLSGLGLYLLLLPVSVNTFLFFYKSTSISPPVLSAEFPMVSVVSGVKPNLEFWLNEGIEPLLPFIVMLWALGVTLLALKTLFAWIGTRWLVRKNVKSIPAALQTRVDGLMNRLHIRQAVSVLVSTRIKVPTVIGWIKPVILLPASVLARLPVQQLEMIIAHELGHIHRYDYLVNLLQVIVDMLFFYHPGVRWMSRRIRQEREHCCDDFVLSHRCQPSLYARALANLEILRQPAHATTLAATGGDLLHRVHRIAGTDKLRKSDGFAQLALITALVVVAGLGASSGLELSLAAKAGQAPVQPVSREYNFTAYNNAGRDDWMGQVQPYQQIRRGGERHAVKDVREADLAPVALNVAKADLSSQITNIDVPEPRISADQVSTEKQRAPANSAQPDSATDDLFRDPGLLSDSLQLSSLAPAVDNPLDVPWMIDAAMMPGTGTVEPETNKRPHNKATVKPIKTVNPKYPSYARSRAVEGWVKLSFTVDSRGRAENIRVVDASPQQTFNRAAEKAMKKWRFEVLKGHDTEKSFAQTFDFSMHPSDVRPITRQRRCNTTGSNICGMNYRQESVEIYGPQNVRMEAANRK